MEGEKRGWKTFIPELKFTTDNAAMIAVTGLFKYREGLLSPPEAFSPICLPESHPVPFLDDT